MKFHHPSLLIALSYLGVANSLGEDISTERLLQRAYGTEYSTSPSTSHQNAVRVSSLPDFKSLGIRLKSPRLCDPTVKQYSGYIDFPTDKHMFFWFFESRRSPAKAPLVLSFGGGPACSSLTGPLSGVGPCNVINGGQDVEYNKVALNDYANVLYIDQLVNVGFSYSTVNVTDSATSAEDVYVFLQVFFKGFPEYAKAPLSVLSAGYGGVHGPYIASTIQRKNKELDEQLRAHPQINSSTVNINLDTVMLGNGITELRTQSLIIASNACNGPYPIYDNPNGPECQNLTAIATQCQNLVQGCYDDGSTSVCGAALNWCVNNLFSIPDSMGIYSYNLRIRCPDDPSKCTPMAGWSTTWLNNQTVKAELGVDPTFHYSSCNDALGQAMTDVGEAAKDTATLIPDLLADGIRFLIYGGTNDYFCSPPGYLQWMPKLNTVFRDAFIQAPLHPWSANNNGTASGMVKAAGEKTSSAGSFTYASIYEAGHSASTDQPEAAYYLFKRWLDNKSVH